MKKSIITSLLLGSTFCLDSYMSTAQSWHQSYGNDNYNGGEAVTTDAAGNVYTTGYFEGAVNFATTTLVSAGDDIFLSKHASNGTFLWAKKAGASGDDQGHALYTDPSGNSYITGEENGAVFLAKYDASGTILWSHTYGSINAYNAGYGICSDGAGNVYVVGYFGRTITFGTISLTSTGLSDVFIAKFDASGNCTWAQQLGGTGEDIGRGIAYLAGNLYLAGWFSSTVTVGTTTLASSGSTDVLIAKYDVSGNPVWIKSAGGVTGDRGNSITTDAAGNCYLAGYFTNNAVFGTTNYSSPSRDQFIAKYDGSGNFISLTHSTNSNEGTSIIVTGAGTVYASGSVFIPYISGTNNATSNGLCIDNSGNIISTGWRRYGQFNEDIFIAKYVSSTGVRSISMSSSLSVFPNPASSTVFIQGLQPSETIMLMDATGRVVMQRQVTATCELLSIESLPSGTYFLKSMAGPATIIKQ